MKKTGLHFCNVLEAGPEGRHLWQFSTSAEPITLSTEQTVAAAEPLPSNLVRKDWRTLWQKKLNVAWLPADQIFLRVAQFPAGDPAELRPMVEFQLEKLSPLPVNQIVWSFEILPTTAENMQTVIVIIAARSVVEEFLGKLESDGYLADRLELPQLHQLLATEVNEDGIWIYPWREGINWLCLIAWWFGGTLQQVELLHLPDSENRGALLVEELTRIAWAGEMEGWLGSAQTRWHLICDAECAALWAPALTQWSGASGTVVEPLSKQALAELTARRVARQEGRANLLPPEFSERYQQQFVDRLWMSGLGAVLAAYMVGVLIYFGALEVLKYKTYRIQRQVSGLSTDYTNAVKLKARVEVLQNQLDLKYAALDCLKVASENLRDGMALQQFSLERGQKLTLQGIVPMGEDSKLTDYNSDLRNATVNGEPLFSKVEQPNYLVVGQNLQWRFTCELKRPEL